MDASHRLSLCMIVRDSSRTLPACLASISPWVDEIVVVDTGSNDDTRDIAVRDGAHVFDFPWSDSFSAARTSPYDMPPGNGCSGWIRMTLSVSKMGEVYVP